MSKPCEYCGHDLPFGVDKKTRQTRSRHFDSCEVRLSEKLQESEKEIKDEPPQFPTMLRKMWSGREVQDWINEHWVTPPQQEAKDEPAQNPVAWMYEINHAHTCLDLFEPPDDAYDEGTLYPLYTTPPQRKPLTNEEICDAVRESDIDWHQGWTLDDDEPNRFMSLARAIEAAHGIKGEA